MVEDKKIIEFFTRENIVKSIKIFSFSIIILLVHSLLVYFKIYLKYTWIDIPMHFTGGVIIGVCLTQFLLMLIKEKFIGNVQKLVFFIMVLSFVSLTILLWEFGEFSLDIIDGGFRQVGLKDTMGDLFLGLTGSIVGYFMTKK